MKKIKNFIKHNYPMIIAAICFFAFVPPFINLLVTTTSPIGFITPDKQETWIGFFGSIIGGGTTLFGVWWTINDQKEQREKDLAIQYRPYLKVDKSNIQFHSSFTKEPVFELNENDEPIFIKNKIIDMSKFDIAISLSNIGRGEITKVNISCIYEDNYISSNFKKKVLDIMPNNSFNLSFNISLNNNEDFVYEDYESVVYIKIDYFDFLNNKYHIEIPIYISNHPPIIQYDEHNEKVYDDGNNTVLQSIGEIIRFDMNK